jgi:Glycosyltransferase family 87
MMENHPLGDASLPLSKSTVFPARLRSPIFIALAAALGFFIVFIVFDAFGALLNQPRYYRPFFYDSGSQDLHRRWQEEACVRAGKNPIDVMEHRLAPPATGRPTDADYPPWALVMGLAFTAPGWVATRLLYTAYNIAALGLIGIWSYSLARRSGQDAGLLMAMGVLAIGVHRAVLDTGQYTIMICALLVAAYWLSERDRPLLAGLALGISMMKYSMSFPFCFCFLVKGRYKTLAVAATCVCAAAMLSWPMIHTPPWISFNQAANAAEIYVKDSPTPLKALTMLRMSRHSATWVNAAVVAAIGAVLLWIKRRDSMLAQFAIACVIARFWTYHLFYDDSMMMFLLVDLGVRAISPHISPRLQALYAAGWLAVGLSLWLTLGFLFRWPVVMAQNLIWIAATASLFLANDVAYSIGKTET